MRFNFIFIVQRFPSLPLFFLSSLLLVKTSRSSPRWHHWSNVEHEHLRLAKQKRPGLSLEVAAFVTQQIEFWN
jgi:hypothetical protein